MVKQSCPNSEDESILLSQWLNRLRRQLELTQHRAAVILSGDNDWGVNRALSAFAVFSNGNRICLSQRLPDALPMKQAVTRLGREYDAILFDARQEFNADALGAIAGTLRGGGVLIMLLPPEHEQPAVEPSRFMQRVRSLMATDKGVYVIEQNKPLPDIQPAAVRQSRQPQVKPPFRTREQQKVVAAIEETVLKQRSRPLVLVSDRGRGKSSALGLAAGRLLQQGIKHILVTAPRLTTTDPLFHQAHRVLPKAHLSRGHLSHESAQLKFIAPDALLLEKPAADLLLVDEAATIPLQLLQAFVAHYPDTVFATTVHGYEGTGRGFMLKFNRVLDELTPGWHKFAMRTPVRWAEHDPLEYWIDRLLCLDAEADEAAPIQTIDRDRCRVCRIDRDELVQQEPRLSSLFALLMSAHYRTRPSDLKHMLDDPDMRLYTLEHDQQILGAVLVNQEGGFDSALARAIYRGERRPAGHLLPQTLSFHAGCEQAATLSYARIMRIAVHVRLQGQGLGSLLLARVIELEQHQPVAAIGTSFGATRELLDFWTGAGFELVRMGFSRDHASGSHSAVMLRPLNAAGEQVFDDVRRRFRHHLPCWLQGPLADLPATLKAHLDKQIQPDDDQLSAADWRDLHSFVDSHRGAEACMWPMLKLVSQHEDLLQQLSSDEQGVIATRIQQNRTWPDVVSRTGVAGKDAARALLRRAIKRLLQLLQA